jgi:hypothetical protein
VVCLTVLKNLLRGILPLYTGGVHIILPQTFGKTNGASRQLSKQVKEVKKFEARLEELEKILNNDADVWLFEPLSEKSKWALAFHRGGSRYGVMTTNISEVFNFVLEGICSLPVSVSWITLFTSVMSNLFIGGRTHATLWQKRSVEGNLVENIFLSRARYQIMKLMH